MVRGNIHPPARVPHRLAPGCLPILAQDPVEKDRCGTRMWGLVNEHGTTEASSQIGTFLNLWQHAELESSLEKLLHDPIAGGYKEHILPLGYPLDLAALVAVHNSRVVANLPVIFCCLLRP